MHAIDEFGPWTSDHVAQNVETNYNFMSCAKFWAYYILHE